MDGSVKNENCCERWLILWIYRRFSLEIKLKTLLDELSTLGGILKIIYWILKNDKLSYFLKISRNIRIRCNLSSAAKRSRLPWVYRPYRPKQHWIFPVGSVTWAKTCRFRSWTIRWLCWTIDCFGCCFWRLRLTYGIVGFVLSGLQPFGSVFCVNFIENLGCFSFFLCFLSRLFWSDLYSKTHAIFFAPSDTSSTILSNPNISCTISGSILQ